MAIPSRRGHSHPAGDRCGWNGLCGERRWQALRVRPGTRMDADPNGYADIHADGGDPVESNANTYDDRDVHRNRHVDTEPDKCRNTNGDRDNRLQRRVPGYGRRPHDSRWRGLAAAAR